MNARLAAHRLASVLWLNRTTVVRLAKAPARALGLDRSFAEYLSRRVRDDLLGPLYGEVLDRVRRDLDVDNSRRHVEDLVGHLDRRMDRIAREAAREDPAMAFVQKPPAKAEGDKP